LIICLKIPKHPNIIKLCDVFENEKFYFQRSKFFESVIFIKATDKK